MITIINAAGVRQNIYNVNFVEGIIKSNTGKDLGTRFIRNNAPYITAHRDEDGYQFFTLNEGWEPTTTKRERKPRTTTTTETTTTATETETATETAPAEPIPNATAAADAQLILELIRRNSYGGNADETSVRNIVMSVFSELAAAEPEKARKVVRRAAAATGAQPEEVFCESFDEMFDDMQMGYYPYMYGAAGCGKSHTAEQLARALGLDFYGQTTIQFAHDVRGYGDAGGNFVDTPFYKAFAFGGVYFQDEYDRSIPEAAMVLNSALANGWYDFPVVGRVNAHPDFHFIAAGNTLMKGGNEEYIGQPMDTSSRDRVIYYEMSYDRRIELSAKIANGNTTLVDFIWDLRDAIAKSNIKHVVSYRATKYANDHEDRIPLEKILKRKVLAALERDEIAVIYSELHDKNNVWAKAMKKLF